MSTFNFNDLAREYRDAYHRHVIYRDAYHRHVSSRSIINPQVPPVPPLQPIQPEYSTLNMWTQATGAANSTASTITNYLNSTPTDGYRDHEIQARIEVEARQILDRDFMRTMRNYDTQRYSGVEDTWRYATYGPIPASSSTTANSSTFTTASSFHSKGGGTIRKGKFFENKDDNMCIDGGTLRKLLNQLYLQASELEKSVSIAEKTGYKSGNSNLHRAKVASLLEVRFYIHNIESVLEKLKSDQGIQEVKPSNNRNEYNLGYMKCRVRLFDSRGRTGMERPVTVLPYTADLVHNANLFKDVADQVAKSSLMAFHAKIFARERLSGTSLSMTIEPKVVVKMGVDYQSVVTPPQPTSLDEKKCLVEMEESLANAEESLSKADSPVLSSTLTASFMATIIGKTADGLPIDTAIKIGTLIASVHSFSKIDLNYEELTD